MEFSPQQITAETERLFNRLSRAGWSESDCAVIAPLTLEINQVKKEKNATIFAHSYMTPDLMYGIADYVGDSYSLSKKAMDIEADTIIFCSVHFMAETAKILNPKKQVVVPAVAGCSLAESITAEDVRNLRKEYPEAGVVCYVNTSAAVKAECDACCTSSNALKIIEGLPQKQIIFLPDEFMAKNLQPLTKKRLISWNGRCIVHEEFSPETVEAVRKEYPGVKILAHNECAPAVIEKVDMAGGTQGMIDYIKKTDADDIMLVTECGMADRMKVEQPKKRIVGACALCPYMKKIMLKDVLQSLKEPRVDQIVELPQEVLAGARKSLDKMMELAEFMPSIKITEFSEKPIQAVK